MHALVCAGRSHPSHLMGKKGGKKRQEQKPQFREGLLCPDVGRCVRQTVILLGKHHDSSFVDEETEAGNYITHQVVYIHRLLFLSPSLSPPMSPSRF